MKIVYGFLASPLLTVVIVSGILGGACIGVRADNLTPQTTAVAIKNFRFTPETITVQSGAMIIWTNMDDVPHQIVSDNHAFLSSPTLLKGGSYTVKLTKPGDYPYHCGVHAFMRGVIRVVVPGKDMESSRAVGTGRTGRD